MDWVDVLYLVLRQEQSIWYTSACIIHTCQVDHFWGLPRFFFKSELKLYYCTAGVSKIAKGGLQTKILTPYIRRNFQKWGFSASPQAGGPLGLPLIFIVKTGLNTRSKVSSSRGKIQRQEDHACVGYHQIDTFLHVDIFIFGFIHELDIIDVLLVIQYISIIIIYCSIDGTLMCGFFQFIYLIQFFVSLILCLIITMKSNAYSSSFEHDLHHSSKL